MLRASRLIGLSAAVVLGGGALASTSDYRALSHLGPVRVSCQLIARAPEGVDEAALCKGVTERLRRTGVITTSGSETPVLVAEFTTLKRRDGFFVLSFELSLNEDVRRVRAPQETLRVPTWSGRVFGSATAADANESLRDMATSVLDDFTDSFRPHNP